MRRRRYLLGLSGGAGALATLGSGGNVTVDHLGVEIVEANDPVLAGELLEVVAEVTNAGSDRLEAELAFVVGGESSAGTRIVRLDPGETRAVEFGHRTFPVRRDVEFPVRVEVGGLADERTVVVRGADDLDGEAIRPDPELTVEPGTPVVFEVAGDALGEYGGRTHWYVDGEYAGWSSGPWYAAYYVAVGADHWRYAFESEGVYTVAASVVGDEGTYTARWTVEVTGDPAIEAVHPNPGTLAVASDEPVELAADVTDTEGALDRVVWWLGHADVVLGVSDVEGYQDTATLDAASLCHRCPVELWVVTADGRVARDAPWTVALDREGTRVRILEANDPVEAGARLEVLAALDNEGAADVAEELRLEVGDEVVDAETVAVDAGGTETVELGYETYPVRTDVEFPVRVAGEADADSRTVQVFADGVGATSVTIRETNDPVLAGERLDAVVDVEHEGEATVTREVHLVAGDRVDGETVTLEPGETRTVELGYETYPVRTDVEFPLRAEVDGDADRRTVRVYADEVPPVSVSIRETNAPVFAGEFLAVVAALENAGEEDVTREVSLLTGDQVADAETVDVEAGGTETVELGYETYPVERDVEFPVTVRTGDAADERTVEVFADDGDREPDVEFESCERAAVTGTFEDGETVSASTGFYDSGGFGDTIREDLLTVGDHVSAPLRGTVVFEVGNERGVSEAPHGATVTVGDYGRFGTAIVGIRTPDAGVGRDYNHPNPHDCEDAIRPDRPEVAVTDVAPTGSGSLAVTFAYENPNDASLFAPGEFEGGTDDDPPGELEPGTHEFAVEWTPEHADERLAWVVDLARFGHDETLRAATAPAGDYLDGGDLTVSIVEANDPVVGGESLEVVADLENAEAAATTRNVELVVDGEVVDAETVTVGGGETLAVALGYETYPVRTRVRFPVTVRTGDDADERTVEVLGRGDGTEDEHPADEGGDEADARDETTAQEDESVDGEDGDDAADGGGTDGSDAESADEGTETDGGTGSGSDDATAESTADESAAATGSDDADDNASAAFGLRG
ncbi:hypothetical protein [Salinilacihabitans rarus]|uniref:hypothetical protein n=1 Tax=Salinilacihabitans rarus TaxID=2961596 RepID=UPI0020C92989|nr:hypothetical protein [Salinilacihabitans rarus]